MIRQSSRFLVSLTLCGVLFCMQANCGGGGSGTSTDGNPSETPETPDIPPPTQNPDDAPPSDDPSDEPVSGPTQTSFVPITFTERAGIARTGDVTTFGLPIAQALNLKSTDTLVVNTEAGGVIPAQFTVTSRWGAAVTDTTAPIRWLLIDLPVTVPANQTVTYRLLASGTPAAPMPALVTTDDLQGIEFNTGPAQFRISKTSASILDRAIIDGVTAIQSAESPGLVVKTVSGTEYRSRDHATLLSTTIERSGPLSAVVRIDGRFPQNFAYEFYITRYLAQYAGVSDEACATHPDGSTNYDCARTRDEFIAKKIAVADFLYPTIEATGPAEIDFSVWIQANAGSRALKVWVTLKNYNSCLVYQSGGVACTEDGSLNTIGVESFALVLDTALASGARYSLVGDNEAVSSGVFTTQASLYQDSSGTDTWDNFKNPAAYGLSATQNDPACPVYRDPFGVCQTSFSPRLSANVSFRGYRFSADGATLASGNQSGGRLGVQSGSFASAMGVRDFWQSYPKTLSVDRTSESRAMLSIGLFPREFSMPHTLRAGEKKTHEVAVSFSTTGGVTEALRQVGAILHPLIAVTDGTYYAKTQTMDYATPFKDRLEATRDLTWNSALIDLATVEVVNPLNSGWPSATLLSMRETYNRYGYKEFGDDPPGAASYEPIIGTDFHKYDFNLGKFKRAISFLDVRTDIAASETFFELARQATAQVSDFGILDTPRSNDLLRRYGFIGHEEHETLGVHDWLRSNMIGSPSIDTFFDAEGLLLGYYLTGFSLWRDDALKLAETTRHIVNESADDWVWVYAPDIQKVIGDFGRQAGNAFRILIAAYRDTHDQADLAALDRLVNLATDSNHFGRWLACPCEDKRVEDAVNVWAISMTLIGFGNYLDLLTESGLTAKAEYETARTILLNNAALISSQMLFLDTQAVSVSDTGVTTTSVWPEPVWTVPYEWYLNGDTSESKNHAGAFSPFYLMTVDALAYAAKYARTTNEQATYMDAARRLFEGGAGYTFEPTWPVGLFSHLGEMKFFATYGDVYRYYDTYGF